MDLSELVLTNPNRHPWELSRMDCLTSSIAAVHNGGNILDVGCGDRYFDICLADRLSCISELWGIDIFAEDELHEENMHFVNSYSKIVPDAFDSILMMDVLEHISDDAEFLKSVITPLLKRDGRIIVTVPAYQWLFSAHDVSLHHFRRYNRKSLSALATQSGLSLHNCFYFYASLLPLRYFSRFAHGMTGTWTKPEQAFVTRVFRRLLNIDFRLCRLLRKTNLTFGLSLYAEMTFAENEKAWCKSEKD